MFGYKFDISFKNIRNDKREEELELFMEGEPESKALILNAENLLLPEDSLKLVALSLLGESALEWIDDYNFDYRCETTFKTNDHVYVFRVRTESPDDLIKDGFLKRIVDEYPCDRFYIEIVPDKHSESATYWFGNDFKIKLDKDNEIISEPSRITLMGEV